MAILGATTFDAAMAKTARSLPSEGDLKTNTTDQNQEQKPQKTPLSEQDQASIKAVKQLIEDIKAHLRNSNSNPYEFQTALRSYPAYAIPYLLDALDTNDEKIQIHMASFLSNLSSCDEFSFSNQSLKTVIALLKSSHNREVKSSLVNILGSIGPRDDSVKEAIIFTLNNSSEPAVKRSALDALANLAQQEKPAPAAESIRILLNQLSNQESQHMRECALHAISRFHSSSSLVVPAVIKMLDDNYATVRSAACQALGQYHAASKPAVKKLIEMVKTENDSNTKYSALNTLANIGRNDPQVIQLYLDLLDDPMMSDHAICNLSNFGVNAAPAVPKLIALLKTGDSNIRHRAAHALGTIGPAAQDAIPVLSETLKDPDATLVRSVEQAIRNIHPTETN